MLSKVIETNQNDFLKEFLEPDFNQKSLAKKISKLESEIETETDEIILNSMLTRLESYRVRLDILKKNY
jgi:hypothetical protein